MDEQEKEFQMTINGLRLQVSLRNTEIVDLHRKNKILRDEIAVFTGQTQSDTIPRYHGAVGRIYERRTIQHAG